MCIRDSTQSISHVAAAASHTRLRGGASLVAPLLCADVQNVVATNESITVLCAQLAIHVLFCLLHRDVHVAIQTREDTSVIHARVELDHHWAPMHEFQEIGGAALAHSCP
eukprot:TRINITY_DN7016_c0_g1_i4.p1 TRINITY_DN7016_c0_g1~~TRINITY_DN7016_c0_g1_i4.p1  ORF type:complete len:110 (-),score=9.66 TRINITY_DN7016_c0_g1_i4:23-352(-)